MVSISFVEEKYLKPALEENKFFGKLNLVIIYLV
jgi:hypothetical protein